MKSNDPFHSVLNQTNSLNFLNQRSQINKIFSEIPTIKFALDALEIIKQSKLYGIPNNSFTSEMFTAYQKVAAIPMTSRFAEILAISKTFSLSNMKAIYSNNAIILDAISNFQIEPLFPQIAVINNLIRKSSSMIITYNDVVALNVGLEFNDSNDSKIISVTNKIDKDFSSVKKDKISLDTYVQIILTIIIWLHSEFSSIQIKNETINEIHKIESRIINEIKNFENDFNKGTFYVIVRQTNGYDSPSIDNSKIKIVLYPNQKIRIISNKGKWIYIEYFNIITNQHEQAWLMKKYSKRIIIN